MILGISLIGTALFLTLLCVILSRAVSCGKGLECAGRKPCAVQANKFANDTCGARFRRVNLITVHMFMQYVNRV